MHPTATQAVKTTNLVSVTPMADPVPPPEIDTTTAIDVSVIPFTQRDMPKWGPWMLYRLGEIWAHFSPINYPGILNQYMGQNGYLFIRAKKAILLAVLTRETLDPRPVVDVVFCFKHDPQDDAHNKDVRLLIRRLEDWGRAHGARYIRALHPERLDNGFARAKDVMKGDDVRFILRDLEK